MPVSLPTMLQPACTKIPSVQWHIPILPWDSPGQNDCLVLITAVQPVCYLASSETDPVTSSQTVQHIIHSGFMLAIFLST